MLRGFTISTLLHASVLAAAVMTWPMKKSDCDKQIERLEREEPGLSPVDILLRLPQCASTIDVPIDIVDIGLVTDVAPIQKVQEPAEEEPEETEPEEQPDPVEEDAEIVEDPRAGETYRRALEMVPGRSLLLTVGWQGPFH